MSQILSAIRFLHLRKIVHCDLKVAAPAHLHQRHHSLTSSNYSRH